LAAKNEEVQKQLKEAKGKIQAEVNSKKEIEAKLNKTIAISDTASKNITELKQNWILSVRKMKHW